MNQVLKLNASGVVKIYKQSNANRILIKTSNNAVLPLAKDIIARSIGQFAIAKIDQVKVYDGVTLLATATISAYSHPGTNQVDYTAEFDNASFNGNFDKLELLSSNMGVFAELTGLTESKTNAESLFINWEITIS